MSEAPFVCIECARPFAAQGGCELHKDQRLVDTRVLKDRMRLVELDAQKLHALRSRLAFAGFLVGAAIGAVIVLVHIAVRGDSSNPSVGPVLIAAGIASISAAAGRWLAFKLHRPRFYAWTASDLLSEKETAELYKSESTDDNDPFAWRSVIADKTKPQDPTPPTE